MGYYVGRVTHLIWDLSLKGLNGLLSHHMGAPSSIVSTAYSSSTSSIWINIQCFSYVGGQHLGGFTGGLWSNGGAKAMAWGWSGGWRWWSCIRSDSHGGAAGDEGEEVGVISGHSGAVKGLDWSPKGDYLVSVGLDQMTCIHGAITSSALSEMQRVKVNPSLHAGAQDQHLHNSKSSSDRDGCAPIFRNPAKKVISGVGDP
ncbi:hypothetical protein BDR03DRAFT_988044 [Suillus americanus]|nr:hypothetical protein BDR03DRAFT_988044 [Suillus americanus]